MITFTRTTVGNVSSWYDAQNNKLEVDVVQFNTVKPSVQYNDRNVTLSVAANPVPQSPALNVPYGLVFNMTLVDTPEFVAVAESITFTDAEFVRLLKARALRMVSDSVAFVS